ncbi:hypothetical protein SUGI_1134080 [Cryptomeria japonica]|uniref:uncharacterized protein LOC131859745 n=1 Tax=Cryptomeria japonica TaxID=3369 RepID=UPI002414CC0F|nr:uncharacterized protein LOC131859745 [Cryptomeria japonica]XP_059069753.1 uncharacterized protein LOC131859747 [Cryptomeria japonica]GLJ53211.1 hypothetical protein SUGI_1134080 [Cryptomeria japonica]
MECSMCGDVGFQIYLFQCTKCSIRFQHQYCSRAYFENESVESISEVCDWCFSIPEEDAGSDVKLMIRDSVKRMRSSPGFGECTNMTHDSKRKRNMTKSCVEIDGQIPKELKKKKNSELIDSIERKNKKRYKLLDEILC